MFTKELDDQLFKASKEVFEKYGIDTNNAVFEDNVKILPKEWRDEAIKKNFEVVKENVKPIHVEIKEDRITCIFDSEEKRKQFDNEFKSNLVLTLNKLISEDKKENPKHYYRNIMYTVDGDDTLKWVVKW